MEDSAVLTRATRVYFKPWFANRPPYHGRSCERLSHCQFCSGIVDIEGRLDNRGQARIQRAGFAVGLAAQKDQILTGEITDRFCTKSDAHDMMMLRHGAKDAKECISACVKAGVK